MRRGSILLIVFLVAGGLHSLEALGQSSDDPLRFLRWMRDDVRAFPGAVGDAANPWIGGSAAGLALFSRWDKPLADDMQSWHRRELWRVVEEIGDANAARPAAILLFVGSLMQSDTRYQDAAFTSLESLILANMVTNGLKLVSGRSRPWQQRGANDWEPFSGRTSFPSGHATTAFALVVPWMIYFPRPAMWSVGALATASALSRVTLQFHWPSDVVAGALIGGGISRWLARRHIASTYGPGARSSDPVSARVRVVATPISMVGLPSGLT